MHGQHSEDSQKKWHMWPGPSKRVSFGTEADSACLRHFIKAGRKIGVGDCALFRADDAPFFIGFIKKLSAEKEGNLKLGVNWLYRLGDIRLGKGGSFEAAPNEIFYSFHEDEISAAALLHPCKVAFLQKGEELPSSVSSFVCRRVYDTANKCLYWLTDQDYTDEHQAEVDDLLDRTKHEMQGTSAEGTSQRDTNLPSPVKQETVNVLLSMQGKSKKRPRTDQVLDPIKREKLMKVEESDAKHERQMKFDDFASIAKKYEGLTNVSFMEQLFQVMLQERSDSVRKLVDTMSRRTLLASIIATTEKEECLTCFVQLGGLRILNDWLQEAHKGKGGEGSPKDGEAALEELLLTLIRALAKLPVDLDALKNCIVGKSVNRLRSHRNSEIQKKAKELVDTWKKRVNAEMKSSDEVKTGTSPTSRAASEAPSFKMLSAKSSAFATSVTNDSNVTGDAKVAALSTSSYKEHSASAVFKESPLRTLNGVTNDTNVPVVKKEKDILPVVKNEKDIVLMVKEEKSCSSSQSQNNSQSWCSGSVKGGGLWKDEVKPIPIAAKSLGTKSHSQGHSAKSHSTVPLISLQKDSAGKPKGEKLRSGSLPEKAVFEGTRAELNNQRLILRLPNPGKSPSHGVVGGSLLDGSATTNKGSAPGSRHDHASATTNRGSPPGSLGRHDHASESIKAAPVHPMGNFGDAKCGKSTGAGIKEESDRSCATTSEDTDCKLASFEHRLKGLSGKGAQGIVQKKLPSNKSSPRLVLDTVQGGIDLLASVAACEVLETERSVSGNTAAEVQPVSADGLRNSPVQPMVDSRHQNGHTNGDREKNGAQAVIGKGNSSNQECELPENSLTKGPLTTAEDEVPGDGVLIVGTHSASLVSLQMKEASPASVSGIEGAVCEGEQRVINATERDLNESTSLVNLIGTSLMGQCQTVSESSLISVDEKCKDAERVLQGCVSVNNTKGLDSLRCYGEDALEVARQVAKEVEQEVEKYCAPEVQDAKLANPSIDLPTSEIVHTGSIGILSGDTDLSGRLSNTDEVPSQQHDQNTVRQCVEPAIDSMTGCKEASEMNGTVFVATAKEECADAIVNLKSSCAEKTPSDTCESKDVERPIFDLNEGLTTDESTATATIPISSLIPSVHCSEQISGLVAQASSLAAPIAVVAATKGAFIPPSNLTRTELGWKAATSAFRPAEPRRVAELSQPSCEAPASTCALTEATSQSGKQPRILDIDLNIADERVLEDSCSIARPPGVHRNASLTDSALLASRPDLDLNRVDGNYEHSSPSLSLISRGTAVSPARGSVIPLAAPRVMLDFDLNDGLGFEEEAPSQYRNYESSSSSVAGGRRQNTDIPNVPLWYSASSTSAAMMMPTFPTSSRSESSYPVVAAPASKSVTTMGHTFGAFSNDIYRGAAVASSSVPYAGSIPASFSYPGFPFGAGFPFTSASYMGSPLNSSASSPPFLTAAPSQLVSAGAVVSSYGRPYLMGSIRDIPGLDSSATWVRPNLDLNTGPEIAADFDTRDNSRPSIGLSQLSYQQAGSLKRKEPEGSFDPFRSSFKQTAWR